LEESIEEYVRSVTSPQTPADLKLALQDKRSTIYKKMENLINMGRAMYKIAEELFQIYLIEQYEASQKEKEEMLKALTRQYVTIPIESPKKMEPHPNSLFNKQVVDSLLSLYNKCGSTINHLQKKIDALDVRLHNLHERETLNVTRWRTEQDNFISELTDELRANQVPVSIRNQDTEQYEDFAADSAEAQTIFRETLIPPPPPLFFNILFNPANTIIHRESVVPVEYIPMKKLEAPNTLAKVQTLVGIVDYAIKTANFQAREESGQEVYYGREILAAMRKNKPAIKVMETKPRDMKAYEDQVEIENKKRTVLAKKEIFIKQIDQTKEEQQGYAKQLENLNYKAEHHHTLKPNN
jgi:hypothetical protein